MLLSIPEPLTKADEKLQEYIFNTFLGLMPSLITFTYGNKTTLQVAKSLLRHRSGSTGTLKEYIYHVYRFSIYVNATPDQMIQNCLDADGDPNPKAVAKYNRLLDDYVGELQANELAPGTVNGYVKGIKALFRCNGLRLEAPYGLSNRVVNKDRSPSPEELTKLLDVANIREKVIETMLATGGFREGTLSKLNYSHVKQDLEAGIVPLHVHVEAEITKGKYNYDTFLGQEAVDYLKIYLQMRRQGTEKIPPENITDDSPLIKSEISRIPKHITPTAIYDVIHNLYVKAGIALKKVGRRYNLRGHSIRKFFRTQLASLGVQADYIEYMMGHSVGTYHDIQMKGVEFLRGIYQAAGLCIRAKLRINKIDALKELIRAWGLNPEEILAKDAMTKGNATVIGQEQAEQNQVQQLSSALKEQVIKELKAGL